MKKKTFHYLTNCIAARGQDILDMKDASQDITYDTLLKHVPIEELAQIFPDYEWPGHTRIGHGLTLGKDFMVSYSKSVYRKQPCYYVTWSAIEYIFVEYR